VFRFLFRKVFLFVFHPGNHAVFLKQSQEPEGCRRAPVPQSCQAADAHPELPAVESGVRIIDASRQNVRQMEPRFEARELFPGLPEQGIRPGFSPEQCVSSVHPVTASNARFHDRFISDRAAGWGIVVPILVPIPKSFWGFGLDGV